MLAALARALASSARHAGVRAVAAGHWLADVLADASPRIRVRDRLTLHAHHPGRTDDQIAEALLRTLGTMVRRTTRQISDLAFLSLQGRVAAKLLDLAGPGQARTRRITQVELATMVGGARQTVNQALRSLESRGYIRSAGRVFEILDREQLRRMAGG